MAKYEIYMNQDETYDLVQRLCRHHDHLKSLVESYKYMRQTETYERMQNSEFRCDPVQMNKLDNSYFTSLIIKLSYEQGKLLFNGVNQAYQELSNIVQQFYPDAKVDIYFDSAHITIKSILDLVQQSDTELKAYLPIVSPIVHKWINLLGKDTKIFGMGLFTNLTVAKGLSVGVRFYPTLPLVQIIRGEVGATLYDLKNKVQLRPETTFHTMLTHSTGFRARNLDFPLSAEFIAEFKNTIEKYDRRIFGSISEIVPSDIYIRNGFSDKLVPNAEINV